MSEKNIKLTDVDIEFMRCALNEALDSCQNQARYKIYQSLLEKLQ